MINNDSIAAHAPRRLSIAHTAPQQAVTGLTMSAYLHGRPHDIAVGQMDVGNAATELTRRAARGARQATGQLNRNL